MHGGSLWKQVRPVKFCATHAALAYTGYHKIEKTLRDQGLPQHEFVTKRKENVISVMEKFHKWLVLKKNKFHQA
jgi:hypothetical protein